MTALTYPFSSDTFYQAWELWKQYRKEIKKSFKGVISEQAQLKKLSRLSENNEQVAISIINQSIENNWQGLFPLKEIYERTNTKQTRANELTEIYSKRSGGFGTGQEDIGRDCAI